MKRWKYLLFIIILLFWCFTSYVSFAEQCWDQELPSGMYCTDWVITNIAPDSVVVEGCYWIKLNTKVPFVWNCISFTGVNATTPINAFPKLMWAMMNLMMTVIMVMSLLLIVYAGVLMTMEWSVSKQGEGMSIIKKVATWMALLWASWVILKLINPHFFT